MFGGEIGEFASLLMNVLLKSVGISYGLVSYPLLKSVQREATAPAQNGLKIMSTL